MCNTGDIMKSKKGFTLLELLVVVLIIGILASIALPQYEKAVTKARVASMLPLMKAWRDALAVYNLENDAYCPDGHHPDGEELGVTWPSDWIKTAGGGPCGNSSDCGENGYWYQCRANHCQDPVTHKCNGCVDCSHLYGDANAGDMFYIFMDQPESNSSVNEVKLGGKVICLSLGPRGKKACEALGGEYIGQDGEDDYYEIKY